MNFILFACAFAYYATYTLAYDAPQLVEKSWKIEFNNQTKEEEIIPTDLCTDTNGISHNCDLRYTYCDRGIFKCFSCE